MKQGIFKIAENRQLTPSTYRMVLEGDTSAVTAPGQFINIRLDGHFLRRPISVCDVYHAPDDADAGCVTIIYKVLGRGTDEMTHFETGRELDVLTGLGNGYDLGTAGARPLLIGGGVGIPPLYLAARRLLEASGSEGGPVEVTVILGFNNEEEIYYIDEFQALGCRVVAATADGSVGISGYVTDAFRAISRECGSICTGSGSVSTEFTPFTHFYTCGPGPMLRAVYDELYLEAGISGQMCFEERMGCGFGACMGCSMKTADGYKRVCKDGPVFRTEELLWNRD